LFARWGWCGAWEYPVGDPLAIGSATADGVPGYQVNRNIGPPGHAGAHQGADLDNRRGGDPVRAAASGLVIAARDSGWNGGYGNCIVIAHRLPEGGVAYSVYAHLAPKSVAVASGSSVLAGERLARVGHTGHATTTHLHFEVRIPANLEEPWENARVVDPIAFVAARLPVRRADSTWAAPYLAWGERAGLVPPECEAEAPLRCADWWRLAARAARHPLRALPADDEALRDSLVAADVLDRNADQTPAGTVHWNELARDIGKLGRAGLRVTAPRLDRAEHQRCCTAKLGAAAPAKHAPDLARRHGTPTLSLACLLLADLAPPPPAPPTKPAKPKHHRKAKPAHP